MARNVTTCVIVIVAFIGISLIAQGPTHLTAQQGTNQTEKPRIITTFAGKGTPGFSGDGGPATQAELSQPIDVAVDAEGFIYIVDYSPNYRIRRVGKDGIITTFAGGINNFSGDGGPAIKAGLFPRGVAIDGKGNVYIADWGNNRIRRVGPDGIITTFAGTETSGFEGDGKQATQAQLSRPAGVTVSADGIVYIADWGNNRIRRVGTDGVITTFAGGGSSFGEGVRATQDSLKNPTGVAVDANGVVYIADYGNSRIRRVEKDGIVTTFAGTGKSGFSGDGGAASQAQLGFPSDVAVDARGNVYIADSFNHRVRIVGPDGIITTFTGTGKQEFSGDEGPATQASLKNPTGVAVDANGTVYIADQLNHRIRRVGVGFPVIRLSVSSLTFDSTAVNKTSQKTFVISNTGSDTLRITGFRSTGSDTSQFRVSPTIGIIVGGSQQTFTVNFTPISRGQKSANLIILNNAENRITDSQVSLSGTGIEPRFSVDTNTLTFEKVVIDTSGQRRFAEKNGFVISNTGSDPLEIKGVQLPEGQGFELEGVKINDKTPLRLAPSESRTIIVSLAPKTKEEQAKQDAIQFQHNGPDSPSIVYIKWTSITPEEDNPPALSHEDSLRIMGKIYLVPKNGIFRFDGSINLFDKDNHLITLRIIKPSSWQTIDTSMRWLEVEDTLVVKSDFLKRGPLKVSLPDFRVGDKRDTLRFIIESGRYIEAEAKRFEVTVNVEEAKIQWVEPKSILFTNQPQDTSFVLEFNKIFEEEIKFDDVELIRENKGDILRAVNVEPVASSGMRKFKVDKDRFNRDFVGRWSIKVRVKDHNNIIVDTTQISFDYSPYLGDYNTDTKMDSTDFKEFANAWKDGDPKKQELSKEIGPVTGPDILTADKIDELKVQRDGIIDIQDFLTFVRVWNFVNPPKTKPTASIENHLEGHQASVTIQGEYLYLGVVLPSVATMHLLVEFDPEQVTLTSISEGIQGKLPGVIFQQSRSGQAEVDIGKLGQWELGPFAKILPKSRNSGDLRIIYQVYDFSGTIVDTRSEVFQIHPIPLETFLFPSYPNPFNPQTTIRYNLSRESDVELSIYNILGQRIRTLVHEKLRAGSYSIVWDGTDQRGRQVASGIYFSRLKTKDFLMVRKMMLLK